MDREKQIDEMAKEMLEISTSANVEPVLEIDGKEIILGESATRVLNNILEQAFIPYLAEKLYNAGYQKQVEAEWIDRYGNKYDNHLYECSLCKETALWGFYTNELGQEKSCQVLSSYCPYCRAKMKGN